MLCMVLNQSTTLTFSVFGWGGGNQGFYNHLMSSKIPVPYSMRYLLPPCARLDEQVLPR